MLNHKRKAKKTSGDGFDVGKWVEEHGLTKDTMNILKKQYLFSKQAMLAFAKLAKPYDRKELGMILQQVLPQLRQELSEGRDTSVDKCKPDSSLNGDLGQDQEHIGQNQVHGPDVLIIEGKSFDQLVMGCDAPSGLSGLSVQSQFMGSHSTGSGTSVMHQGHLN